MPPGILQDRLHRAAGRGAIIVGAPCYLHRPANTLDPLSPETRILKMHAAFLPIGGRLTRTPSFGEVTWQGIFDAAYTTPGDLLHRSADDAVFFIASQPPLLPTLCIRASRRVDITRPAAPASAGLNAYGGALTATDTTIATAWPAAILGIGGQGTGSADIAADLQSGAWQVLLPLSLNIGLRTGDKLTDDTGRIGIIASIELSDLGWRLLARQAST